MAAAKKKARRRIVKKKARQRAKKSIPTATPAPKVKPRIRVIGRDGNLFGIVGICEKALRDAGQDEEAEKMSERVHSCGSYNEAVTIMQEYCEFS